MNNKSIVLAGAISLSLVSMAGAASTNYVYMTGSTAARAQVNATLQDVGVVFDAAPAVIAQGDPTINKSTWVNFIGHQVGAAAGVMTSVKTHWSGSEAGLADLVGIPATETFLDDASSSATNSPGPFVSSAVDLAMVDADKAYSLHPGANVTGKFCGVIPFKWVKEKGSLASITGVTDAQLRTIFSGGSPAALITGNSADTTWVYITGRDSGSGTRVNTFGDTGYGIFSAPAQLEVHPDGSMIDQTGLGDYLGDYGYSSGGSVATQMGYDLSLTTSVDLVNGPGHFSVLGYLGYSDAGSAVTKGGTELTYNGVTESTAAIREGQYGFWGNEFIYKKNVGLTAQAGTVYTSLSTQSTGINHHADNLQFIDLTTMHATRNGPLSDPVHN